MKVIQGGSHCFRCLAMIAVTAAVLASPPRPEAQELTKITIALPVLASVVMPLYYARDAGLFKKYGLGKFHGIKRIRLAVMVYYE